MEQTHLPMTSTELNRLRWRCRRGLLENDLILARYLEARGSMISAEEVVALDRLLDLPDDELWDLIAGRSEAGDPELRPVVAQLRSA
jgi:antitoxin CptB